MLPMLPMLAVLGLGCGADSGDAGAAEESDEEAGTSSSTPTGAGAAASSDAQQASPSEPLLDPLTDCEEPARSEVRRLSGPGYDRDDGLIAAPEPRYVASTTAIILREGKLPRFFEHVGAISAHLDGLSLEDGLVAYGLALDPSCDVYRTLALWTSEEAMYAFVVTEAHAVAMSEADELGHTGKVAHWEVTAADLPLSWDMALAQLRTAEHTIGDGYSEP